MPEARRGAPDSPKSGASPKTPKTDVNELLSADSPASTVRSKSNSKKSTKRKAAEEAKRKAEELRAELQRQEEEATKQLEEASTLKEEVVAAAMRTVRSDTLAAGFRHSCVVAEDGSLVCFGTSGRGQCDLPIGGDGRVTSVAAGNLHTVAVREDGGLCCFGETSFGQCTVPENLVAPITAVSAGFCHTCALDAEGRVFCFGDDTYGQCSVPPLQGKAVAVSAGFRHTCVLTEGGSLVCFGDNSYGQCEVPNLEHVRLVACGDFHTCAVTRHGQLHCFGRKDSGQCDVPSSMGPVIAVAAGSNFTVAVLLDGRVWCQGSHGHGQTELPMGLELAEFSELDPPYEAAASMELEESGEVEIVEDEVLEEVSPTSADLQKMMSTAGSWATDTTLTSLTSEIQDLRERLAQTWEEAYSLAQQFVDNIRGVACGSFHACLLQKDAQLFFFGDDSANQCRVPETLVPKVFTVDPAQLPLGILADRKPKLLESAPEPEPNPDPPQPP
ncbi:unnamed protein product [Effrenium voratum]|uniref:Uncharacterized protein n=1 Tax=Effrenium voratum TaxID=2562239 RepID=A0AA36JGM1_9DINO|nr:unnamed protein product [Effrenium voratum]